MVWLILNTLKINNRNMLRNTVTQLRNVTPPPLYIGGVTVLCYGSILRKAKRLNKKDGKNE